MGALMILVSIAGNDGSTPVKYSWQRQTDADTSGLVTYWPDVVQGGPLFDTDSNSQPAYEINSNPSVPIGAVVEAWLSENGECLQFLWQPVELPTTDVAGPPLFVPINGNAVTVFNQEDNGLYVWNGLQSAWIKVLPMRRVPGRRQ